MLLPRTQQEHQALSSSEGHIYLRAAGNVLLVVQLYYLVLLLVVIGWLLVLHLTYSVIAMVIIVLANLSHCKPGLLIPRSGWP